MPMGVGPLAPPNKGASLKMLAHKNNNIIGFEAKLGFDHFEGRSIFEGHFNNTRNIV